MSTTPTLPRPHTHRPGPDDAPENTRPDVRAAAPGTTHPDTTSSGTTHPGTRPDARPERRAKRARTKRNEADDMAVASFVMGLTGLLVFSLVLGPCALVLGGLALRRDTGRRGRAVLGMVLGAVGLVVLAVTTTATGTVSWSLAG